MDEYKSVNRYLNQKKDHKNLESKNSKKYLLAFINKSLLSALLFISALCIIKIYPDTK